MPVIPASLFGDLAGNTDPLSTDTRREGDDNLRNLAESMSLSMPGLTDTGVTVSGAHLNDTPTVTGGTWSTTGAWGFAAEVSLSGALNALKLNGSGDQAIRKTTAGDLRIATETAGSLIDLNPEGVNTVTLAGTNTTLRTSANVVGQLTADSDLDVTGNLISNGELHFSEVTSGPATGILAGWKMAVRDSNGVLRGYVNLVALT